MKQKCITKLGAVAGRELSAADVRRIEERLDGTMRRLARQDRAAWLAMTRTQQLMAAADVAAGDIRAEAARTAAVQMRQLVATAEANGRIDELQQIESRISGKPARRVDALKRDMVNTWGYIRTLGTEFRSMMFDTIEAAGNADGVGMGRRLMMAVFDAENPGMTRAIAHEIFSRADGSSGDIDAQAAAAAWLKTNEAARSRFNAAGGDIRALEGYIPQPWASDRVGKAGADAFAADVLPHVDRSRYVHGDGRLMDDAEVRDLLAGAWETLATEGLNKLQPGQFRSAGKTANRHRESRVIHFATGDGYMQVMSKYGRGSLYEAMSDSLGTLARDIALMERYGPDPAGQMRLQFDATARADGSKVESLAGSLEIEPRTYWRMISGEAGTPANQRLATVGQTLRALQVASKLGRALWSSLADVGGLAITAGYNRLPYWQLLKDVAASGTDDARAFLSTHGLIADTIAANLDRLSGDHLANQASGKVANATTRLGLLNAWETALRQGFRMSMAESMARLSALKWDALTEFDRIRLQRTGVTADDWALVNQVTPDVFRGRRVLTPQAVRDSGIPGADQVATRIFSFVQHEAEHAVMEADLSTRAVTTWGGLQAGTPGGELARTIMQFKAFPFAMISRHWRRAMEGDLGAADAPVATNRFVYGGALLASSIILGAVGEQVIQVLGGKDPINPGDHPSFWLKAALRGGALSIAGDMLLTDTASGFGAKEALGRMVLGPTYGTAADLWELTKGNVDQYMAGQDTHWQAETVRFGASMTPLANLWWLRPMIDHAVLDNLNENLSPGYLARMRQRAYKAWGSHYWWAPGHAAPDRAPDLAEAFGG